MLLNKTIGLINKNKLNLSQRHKLQNIVYYLSVFQLSESTERKVQIKISAVGKIKENYIKAGINEYSKRLTRYIKLEIVELEDEPCPEKASDADGEKIKQTDI